MKKFQNLVDKLYKYLVAAIIVIIPLYPKFPFIRIPGTYVSIRFEDFLLATTALFVFVKLIPNIKKLFINKISRSMLLFLLIGFVSLVSGILITKTVVPSIGVLHLLRRLEYFVPFFAVLAFYPAERSKNLEFYIKTLMIVVFLAFFYGLGQKYFDFPVIITQDSESAKGIALKWIPGSQITSTFAGHYDLASFMVLVLPIFIGLFFAVKDKASKIFLALVSFSGFWLLILTGSRISFFSYLLAICVSLFLMKKTKAVILVVVISLVMSGFSASLSARYKNLINVLIERIKNVKIVEAKPLTLEVYAESVKTETTRPVVEPTPTPVPILEDRSTSIRLNIEWPRAVRSFLKNPFLGTGYSSIGLATDNDYLRLLAEVGGLGFFCFSLIIVRILIVFASALPLPAKLSSVNLGFVAGTIGGLFGTLFNAVFIDVFEASKFAITFWLIIGLAVFLVKDTINEYTA